MILTHLPIWEESAEIHGAVITAMDVTNLSAVMRGKGGEVGMTVPELNVLKATRITAKDMPISMNAASERLHDFAIEWEEHNERFEDINPFFVALREIRDKSLKWQEQEPRVMTLEEVKSCWRNREIAFLVEYNDSGNMVWMLYYGYLSTLEEIVLVDEIAHLHNFGVDGYGIDWRCWTSRPTDAQREAEPWTRSD